MKRKRKQLVAPKGTPSITKFFKKAEYKVLDCKIIIENSSLQNSTRKSAESTQLEGSMNHNQQKATVQGNLVDDCCVQNVTLKGVNNQQATEQQNELTKLDGQPIERNSTQPLKNNVLNTLSQSNRESVLNPKRSDEEASEPAINTVALTEEQKCTPTLSQWSSEVTQPHEQPTCESEEKDDCKLYMKTEECNNIQLTEEGPERNLSVRSAAERQQADIQTEQPFCGGKPQTDGTISENTTQKATENKDGENESQIITEKQTSENTVTVGNQISSENQLESNPSICSQNLETVVDKNSIPIEHAKVEKASTEVSSASLTLVNESLNQEAVENNTSPKKLSDNNSGFIDNNSGFIDNNSLSKPTSLNQENFTIKTQKDEEENHRNNSCATRMESGENDVEMSDSCKTETDEHKAKRNAASELEDIDDIKSEESPNDNKDSSTLMEHSAINDDDDDDDDDDDSDDELLSTPAFLCDYRVKPEIKTPEKCFIPLTGSPLTPISPYKEPEYKETVKCRYSLKKLVLEKPKQEKKNQEMARLRDAIHEQIEKGKMGRWAEDTGTESEEDDYLLPVHKKELDRLTLKDKLFDDEIPGENIFPEFKTPLKLSNGCCQPFPTLDTEPEVEEFAKTLFEYSDVQIQELLCGGWIVQRYLLHPCCKAVIQWLVHVLSYHHDNQTAHAAYNALWSLLNADTSNSEQPSRGLPWMPNIAEFCSVLYNYGATRSSLRLETAEDETKTEASEADEGNVTDMCDVDSKFPEVNLTRLIQFMTLCVSRSSQLYDVEQLEHFVISLCRLSLDLRMELCLHDIKTCLEAVYSSFDQKTWPSKAKKLSCMISGLADHHRHKLHLTELQPHSCRGQDVRRLVALQALGHLVSKSTIGDEELSEVMKTSEDAEDKGVIDLVKCFETLEKILCEIRIIEDTDYYKLYTIIEVLDLAVGAEPLMPLEKGVLHRILTRLRLIYKDIKDPLAMFISRTKVKDLLLRTLDKFNFMTQGKKGLQRGISAYFEKPDSDLYIETLKDNEEDGDTEILFGSEYGSSSPAASDISDQTTETNEETTQL